MSKLTEQKVTINLLTALFTLTPALLSRVIHQHQSKSNLLPILQVNHYSYAIIQSRAQKQLHLDLLIILIWQCVDLIYVKYSDQQSLCKDVRRSDIIVRHCNFTFSVSFCLVSFLHRLFPPVHPSGPLFCVLIPPVRLIRLVLSGPSAAKTAGIEPSDSHTYPPLCISLFCLSASYFSH